MRRFLQPFKDAAFLFTHARNFLLGLSQLFLGVVCLIVLAIYYKNWDTVSAKPDIYLSVAVLLIFTCTGFGGGIYLLRHAWRALYPRFLKKEIPIEKQFEEQ